MMIVRNTILHWVNDWRWLESARDKSHGLKFRVLEVNSFQLKINWIGDLKKYFFPIFVTLLTIASYCTGLIYRISKCNIKYAGNMLFGNIDQIESILKYFSVRSMSWFLIFSQIRYTIFLYLNAVSTYSSAYIILFFFLLLLQTK